MKKFYMRKKDASKWSSVFRRAALAVMFTAGSVGVDAQVSGYTFSQANGTFASIASTGSVVSGSEASTGTSNDTAGWAVTLPFTFNYNGADYTSAYVNSNGAAIFGATTSTSSTAISATAAYDGAVAVMNRDLWGVFITSGVTTSGSNVITNVVSMQGIEVGKLLNNVNGIPANTTVTAFDPVAGTITMSNNATSGSSAAVIRYGTGRVYTATEGTAPNRVFVIEWKGYNDYGITAAVSNHLNFQLRLAEGSNTITAVYGPTYNISTTSRTNQIGLRGATNTDFNNRTGAAGVSWTATTAGTTNAATVARDNVNYPASGLTFTWSVPTCFAPTTLTTGTLGLTSAQINWVAPAQVPAMGYEIYYNTTGVAPSGSTVLDGTNSITTAAGSTTGTLSGLTSGTQYYIWIRGRCSASESSNWSSGLAFATACAAVNAPYSQNFDSTPVGSSTSANAPACWSYVEPSGWPGYGYVSTNNSSTPNGYYLYATDTTGGGMLVSPQTTNLTNGLNRVRFKASGGGAAYNLEVGTLSNPTDASTFTAIGAPITLGATSVWGDYTIDIPAGTNQYLAFRHPGQTGSGTSLRLDDIFVEAAPTCFEPTAVQVTAGSVTSSSGVVTWTPPTTTNPTGYEIYYSTVNVAPTAATVLDATNSLSVTGTTATVSGLAPSTPYYIWVRSVCSATDRSIWTQNSVNFRTLCQPPTVTGITVSPNPVCVNGMATLTANTVAGATINWYADGTATTPLATGASYTTPALAATTNYYVSASTASTQSAAVPNATSTSGYTLEAGLFFDAVSNIVIEGVYVYPIGTGAGTVTIALQNGNVLPATTLETITVNLTGTASPGIKTFVPLNFSVPAGTGYKLMMMNRSGLVASLVRESGTSWGTYPITTPGVLSITNGNCCSDNVISTSYYYFYDWQVSSKCESPRTMVTATVDSSCTMGTSETNGAKSVSIYPNPFTDVLNISDVKNVKSISVLDISGRVVKSIDKPTAQIHLGDLKSGMYLISLQYKDGSVHTMKAIKK